jgi:hypothetical protein
MIDPNRKLKRAKDGWLASIKVPEEETRKVWEYPNEHQDHVCKIYGYCPIHKTDHSHPERPKPPRARKAQSSLG